MKFYLEFDNNFDAFPETTRESFKSKYDVAKKVKYKPDFWSEEGSVEFIFAGRDGEVKHRGSKCLYKGGKYDLYTIDGLFVIGGFDYFEFPNKFVLYWNAPEYDKAIYMGYKRLLTTSYYDFSNSICLVLTLDFKTFINHRNTQQICPRGIFSSKEDLITKIGQDHLLDGYVTCSKSYIVSDFIITGKDTSFINNIKEYKSLDSSRPYKLLSFLEDDKFLSINLFQDLQAPQSPCDFLVLINDKVGVFTKDGYKVDPIYDSGYSDNCHYSFILSKDGKKRYWDIEYKTYKISEGRFDFHIDYLENSLKDSLMSRDSLPMLEGRIKKQLERAKEFKEHPELARKKYYSSHEWTEEDTWDAMTDGMYGDYPGGDVDYEVLGF